MLGNEEGSNTSSGPEPVTDPRDNRTIIEEFASVIRDAKLVFEAEVGYQKARVSQGVRQAKSIAISVGLALALIFAGILAFILGLVIALTTIIGPWWSMVAVTAGCFVAALILLLKARSTARRTKRAVFPNQDQIDEEVRLAEERDIP
jgi:hypothetical protein